MDLIYPPSPLPLLSFDDGLKSVGIEKFAGKYVLMNFWATWCAPCVTEMPSLDKLAVRLHTKGLIVVAVSQDLNELSKVKSFLKPMMLKEIVIWYDEKNKGFRELGLRGLPTTILINPDGLIVAKLEGSAEWNEGPLLAQIEEIIKNDSS
ncbi:MAG: TlpA family protein disulfide reductase [Gammaproteobacteria bacterium]|nr:TlpA family protein disulfide reductase [Gammaproteobacteria bacterium]MDA7737080.1 TlpA family protein disulfide reductase [Porticoccus sp.]